MLMRRLCGSGMWSNEQGEYCSSVFCSDLDHLNCSINYLLYFTITLLTRFTDHLKMSKSRLMYTVCCTQLSTVDNLAFPVAALSATSHIRTLYVYYPMMPLQASLPMTFYCNFCTSFAVTFVISGYFQRLLFITYKLDSTNTKHISYHSPREIGKRMLDGRYDERLCNGHRRRLDCSFCFRLWFLCRSSRWRCRSHC